MTLAGAVAVVLAVAVGCNDRTAALTARGVQAQDSVAVASACYSLAADSAKRARIVHVPRPEVVRGLYVNRWAALGKKSSS